MKRKLLGVAAIVLGLGLSAPAFAQQPLPQALGGEGAFHNFLENHPRIRGDLVKNPNLVNDPQYIQAHPQFNAFYQKHPEVRTELGTNAPDYMRREQWGFKHPGQYDRSYSGWNSERRYQKEERNADTYFDSHPEIERKLEQNPALANNPEFLKRHPGFAGYEQTHPGVAQQLQKHPRKFMNNEENYDSREHR